MIGLKDVLINITILIRTFIICPNQGGITCEAIDEPRKSSKAIDKRVIINFWDKNVVIARFCGKNEVLFYLFLYTRSYAALRAADLDWIVGSGYSFGGYNFRRNH